jgi:hypothetical protein
MSKRHTSKRHKHKRFFVQLFNDTMDAPAWREMSIGARMLYIALKRRYNRKTQGAVFLSVRTAADELNSNKDSITNYYHELGHFGFVTCVNPARIGKGKGMAALYRLADEPYKGEPPAWNSHFGTAYDRPKFPDTPYGKTGHPVRNFRTVVKGGRQKSQ